MPLFQRRRQEREKAERVAKGESIPVGEFDRDSRTRILYAITDCAPANTASFAGLVRTVLLREWGRFDLVGEREPGTDLANFVVNSADEAQLLDVIEATFESFERVYEEQREWRHYRPERDEFRSTVNRILDEHDIPFQVVGSEVVPRGSMAMYANVVEPTLSLLSGRPELRPVERAFGEALRELKPGGNAGDAITDAARALQEMLTAAGAEGDSLGPLLSSARKKELLGPYDTKLADGVALIGGWVSADRSGRGDAHAERDPTLDDAWLAVHVTGALIVRLAKRL